jgi:hypothetical protein
MCALDQRADTGVGPYTFSPCTMPHALRPRCLTLASLGAFFFRAPRQTPLRSVIIRVSLTMLLALYRSDSIMPIACARYFS